ncbi:MAG: PD40 domain-containing protein [Verrucomicrobia bacterium]|nr:PD40 domain-containing protein [Verrucomicrobiota bacterium]
MKHKTIRLVRLFCAAAILCATAAIAQLAPPGPPPVVGARMPALSPDGKRIAFAFRGDIWLATSDGGRALPLTQHIESDAHPVFSPDGKWLAFGSRRNGNWDIYVMPADGGAARQITWHAGADIPHGWSHDGKFILFSSRRDSQNYALYAVDVATLRTLSLSEDYAPYNFPNMASDGKTVVFGRYGFPATRPRYTGAAAAQIWLYNTTNAVRRALTQNDRQHLWPRFLPDNKRIVTVTVGEATPSAGNLNDAPAKFTDSPARTPNLWLVDMEGREKQLTFFTGGAVRAPAVAAKSGDIAFEYGADLWLLKSGKKDAVKLKLFAAADDKQTELRREKITPGVVEAEPGPKGKYMAFGARGEIWRVLTEKSKGLAARSEEIALRLTDWAGDDSDFNWSADGGKLYFTSDRELNVRLYELDVNTLAVKSLWNRPEDVAGPSVSPDGKLLAFWVTGAEGGLFVLPTTNGEPRRVAKVPGPHRNGYGGGGHAWSPDGQWLAYTRRGENHAWNIWLAPVAGGEPVNVTRLNAHHSQPAWSPDGKYLFFQSNRDGDGLYVLPLQREPLRVEDTELKFEKPKENEPVKMKIDFADITRRIHRLALQNPNNDLAVTAEGLLVFLNDGDVWSLTYDGKESKRLTTGGGKSALRVFKDGKRASFLQGGEMHTLKLGTAGAAPEKVKFTADWERDVRAERKAAFNQFWRTFNRAFYDPNFHGRDWPAIRKQYEPLLDSVETGEEFAGLLNQMIGELDASHSEVAAAKDAAPDVTTPHLGFAFDYAHAGPGLKVARVPAGAPGSYERTLIRPGEFVLAINGRDVALNEKLYQLINDKQDREFEFLVNTKPDKDGARTVKYKVMSQSEWMDLNYQNRTDTLRKYTEQASGGKIGYLHLSAMGTTNQLRFEREAYEYFLGKEAMILDVRFNRGGNISDTLIDWLERKQHGWSRPRDAAAEPAPARAWEKPVIVLMNEHSYSNGEMFPYAMRQRGLARLVGMPTPGYVIWTTEFRLVDGTGARMPGGGVFRMDGTNMENHGEKPDIQIWLTPDDWVAGRDPQLDKALELLKK